MLNDPPKIIVVCGPTGVGKTSLAIDLAKRFDGEVVSADSMQVYRYMDIGTAKPTPAELAEVPHHMIDILDPDEDFNAARYAEQAGEAVMNLARRGKVPFVAGGTGLYIKALIHGVFESGAADRAARERLKKAAAEHEIEDLYQRLAACDPETAKQVHPNDAFRIIRALEAFEAGGEPVSSQRKRHGFRPVRFDAVKIGLNLDRALLYDRINRRADHMIAAGLLREVRGLMEKGYAPELKSMQSIGYRHMTEYILGLQPWDEAVRTLKRDTRRYAKRQLTWFGADADIHWRAPGSAKESVPSIDAFLNS